MQEVFITINYAEVPPHPFFEGKALGTRLGDIYIVQRIGFSCTSSIIQSIYS